MITYALTALRMTALSIAIFGFCYPIVMTGIAQAAFPRQAGGSFVIAGGRIVGSSIIGERWTQPRYFHGRPSAAGVYGYDPTSTGGTNLGPTSKKLLAATAAAIAALRSENPDARGRIPMDLVTSSGSGIDPDISPEAAYYQAPRVARARGMRVAAIDDLIARRVRGRTWLILGEPRVNVLELNLALDRAARE